MIVSDTYKALNNYLLNIWSWKSSKLLVIMLDPGNLCTSKTFHWWGKSGNLKCDYPFILRTASWISHCAKAKMDLRWSNILVQFWCRSFLLSTTVLNWQECFWWILGSIALHVFQNTVVCIKDDELVAKHWGKGRNTLSLVMFSSGNQE